ncbi:MAG: ATP-binding cassette domain-containing protein, partial [Planctomycetia bacterium]|nr:ATP-binding cassette domain-containing protein [Planctomycetia bacterium]
MDAPADAVEPAAGTPVEVCELTLSAGGTVLLESASASFAPGRVALVIGPSGAGKSLLLKIIAGLVRSDGPGVQVSGKVLIDGREVPLGGARPSVGVVFQNFALFDELSPLQNVRFAFAHRDNHKPHPGDAQTPAQLLVELGVPTKTRTALLSGGQRQRLAIARTLAHRPDVVLYDGPTSGLDAATAEQVARLIERTHAAHPKTSIIVTHDYQALA